MDIFTPNDVATLDELDGVSGRADGIARSNRIGPPNYTGNANLVPVVANGEVFVASYQQLQIFGLDAARRKGAKKRK